MAFLERSFIDTQMADISSQRAKLRFTARCIIPSMAFQLNPIKRDTADMDASFKQSMTRASNMALKPEFGSAHGADAVTTP